MKLEKLIERDGYKNDTVRICEFLGFTDTEQLKGARFFSEEEGYVPTLIPGLYMNDGKYTWHLCELSDGDRELHTIDYGYKFRLNIIDGNGHGGHLYYQSDFLSLLKNGNIIYAGDGKCHIEHIKWMEKLCGNVFLVHEADVVVKEK